MKMAEQKCECGGKLRFYDGCLGYEAMVCLECGDYYDYKGKNDADEWSMNLIDFAKAV